VATDATGEPDRPPPARRVSEHQIGPLCPRGVHRQQRHAHASPSSMTRRTVNDVMTRAVAGAYRGASFKEIVQVMIERGITAMPVIEDDHRVAGVVSESDLLAEQAHIDQHQIKRLPVVDEENRLVGIVSRRDLLRVFTRTDEEIRDEILQEVFARLLPVDAAAVSVRVSHGVVTLTGTLLRRSLIPIAVRLTAATDGVVSVINELNYADDDCTKAARAARTFSP
jgi:CBS-domain-containing membrane protein